MPQFYVYVYRDPSRKNEPIYVGKGFGNRAYEHLNDAQNNHFKNRLAKMKANGIEPIINVVGMPCEALAIQCEIDTIARFGRKDLDLGPVLNMTDGGEGASGRITRDEQRKKQSDAMKGKSFSAEHRRKLSDAGKGRLSPMKGKSHSAKTRSKMSDTHKGIPKPRITCPHCGKEGGIPQMKRYHFDKCKSRNKDDK